LKKVKELLLGKKLESGRMKAFQVPISISYRCKQCNQLAVKPETTKENLMLPLWHDCENNVWQKSEKLNAERKVA